MGKDKWLLEKDKWLECKSFCGQDKAADTSNDHKEIDRLSFYRHIVPRFHVTNVVLPQFLLKFRNSRAEIQPPCERS